MNPAILYPLIGLALLLVCAVIYLFATAPVQDDRWDDEGDDE